MQPPDYYKILGVPFGASIEEVSTAYKKLSKKFHPDVNEGDPFFEEKFKEVNEAYEILTDPVRREQYHQQWKNPQTPQDSNMPAQPAYPVVRKKRAGSIAGTLFGIILIAVVVFKFVNENKKLDDTKQTLTSLNLLPKDSTNNVSEESTTPAGSDHAGESGSAVRGAISITRDDPFIMTRFDDENSRFETTPSFTILNAKDVTCHAVVYFYNSQGKPLNTPLVGEYTNINGNILSSVIFTPGADRADYNMGGNNFQLSIPYSRFYLSSGTYDLEYQIILYDDKWNVLDKSDFMSFRITFN